MTHLARDVEGTLRARARQLAVRAQDDVVVSDVRMPRLVRGQLLDVVTGLIRGL
jgi:hypothetical protein